MSPTPDAIVRSQGDQPVVCHRCLVCPSLVQKTLSCMLRSAPDLFQVTQRKRREQGGVLVRRAGRVFLRAFRGPSQPLSIPPACGLHRAIQHGLPLEVRKGEDLLGEYHTHPYVDGVDMAPPSASDLYQLALAAGKEQHNCSFVVAPEGTYLGRMAPSACTRILADLRRFLAMNHVDPAETERCIERCDQPLLHLARRMKEHIPELWNVLQRPMEVFEDCVSQKSRDSKPIKERIAHFIREMAGIGVDIVFYETTEYASHVI